ncbi:MAG TPA: glycosyltransferase [Candidatus Obscuribacterales bacterium]
MQVKSQSKFTQNSFCKVCGSISPYFAQATVLNRYRVDYFKCSVCGFVQTEKPYWLDEAYADPIAMSDVGLVARNFKFSQITQELIISCFNPQGKFLDYGCGYGLFVRLMRDLGFDFYGYDQYCQNIFYQGFEGNQQEKYDLVTTFEVFEHFINPLEEIEKLLQFSKNLLFSTQLLPADHPQPDQWWYYALHEGQHIGIYTYQSLLKIAEKFKLNLYSDGSSLHLLTEHKISGSAWKKAISIEISPQTLPSLTEQDFLKAVANRQSINSDQQSIKIIIDGVFFQIRNTGIARVWKSLLEEWSTKDFAQQIIVLDREGTTPKIPGIKYYQIPEYNYDKIVEDRQLLQNICDQENADLFISTYYTTPLTTPSVFMGYDMIPEQLGLDLTIPMWQEKHHGIEHASAYITISENTAQDLVHFFPKINKNQITVAHCGVPAVFSPATSGEVQQFKFKYSINKPYFILVGQRLGAGGYKNTLLFFKALTQLKNNQDFEIVCVGGEPTLEAEFYPYIQQFKIHLLQLSDQELKQAYSGATALVYPSKYEGFGMPIIEAMACGCPVITCRKGSIPEIAGNAAYYVDEDQVLEMLKALEQIQKPEIYQPLIQAGLQQSSQYSWSKMANIIQQTLIQTVQNLKTSTKPLDFQDFTYSKRSHFNQFKRFKAYSNINPDACDLKIYQDLLVYNFITQNLPKGAKLLEIGGGNSRVLEALKQDYECWNLDKFEGVGNGPNQIQNYANSRIILDYIGNFNSELPDQYFDCVFSISTLEHITEDEITFDKITQDMDRILKPLGFSLHCFDVVVKPAEVWTNQFLPYLFKTQKTLNSRIDFDQIKRDPDLYGMSEKAYRQFWQPTTQKSYQEFGQPISYNILWQKSAINFRSVSPKLIISSSLPKISIVTPSLNQGEFLEECIDSILSQNYPNLEYIIMDGGSTDNSVEIIKKYEKYLTHWQSQGDGGHYAAVNAGFQKTTGEIMGWLNSDDKYHPDAFYKLAATFGQNKQVEWVMGIPTEWDRNGKHIHSQMQTPLWSRKMLLDKQWVEQYQQLQHTWIQQESTFWTRSLWEKAGSKLQTNLNLAGDFELWLRFSRYAPLYLLRSLIGGFRTYDTQRSKIYREQYFQEVKQIVQEELQLIEQGKYSAEQLSPPVIVLEDHQVLALKQQVLNEPKIKVSAIISTYNSASMMSGRLENLVGQTLFQQGKLEIIVVDSGSQENEQDIILEFKKQYPDSIIYIKTEAREPIYQAWNRGIAIARGEYITNQNTDDRLKLNALERLSTYLDEHSEVILVHADQQAVSPGESVNLEQLNGKPHWKWPEFSRLKLLFSAQVGSQPMWRKSLHHNYGLFDQTLKVRGDQDFYIRIANAGEFHFIPEILGTLNLSENSLSHQQDLSREEEVLIFKRYTSSREKLAQFLNHPQIQPTDQNYQILVNNLSCDLANQVLSQFHLPFYIKLITELLNSVVELGTYQQTVQTNLLRIWNRFSDPATRFQFMKTLSPQIIETCDEKIQLKGEGMEKIDPVQMYINLSKLSQVNSPKIDPVFSPQPRPFWSVIIPNYNGEKYIEQVLNSVLTQAPSSEEMEIIIVDDCSTNPEIETIVKNIGKNRVKFYRQPQNLGLIPNWNDCIKRATGQWIHLLHQDDLVLPGFYTRMRELLEKEPTAGAGFCRHYYIDEQGKQRSLSALEQETNGIISNWLERIAVMQRIQFAAMVVKRSVYETLGGFSENAGSAADWEMWKRISAYYPVAYEPQPLACYRLHSTSESSKLISIGANISDTLKSIEISQSYLPENLALNLSNKAREHYGLYAINTAQQLLVNGEAKAVISQIQEALKCSQSDVVKQAIIELFTPQKPKAQIKTLTPAQILAEVSHLTEEYKKTNNPDSLRQIRQIIAQYWLALESENLEKTYGGEIGQAHKILLNSGLKNEALTSLEKAQLQDWYTYLKHGLNQPKGIQHLLAIILYSYPYQLSPNWYIQAPIPKWFLPDYFEFMLAVPQFFQERGETELYYRYLENWISYIHERFISHPEFSIWQELAWKFTQIANFIPLYFNTANLKDIYIKRAEIMEFALTHLGYSIDYQFPQRPTHQKIRVGILSNHFLPQTETYSTLPVFEYLDSTQFEVILYTLQSNNHPLEKYCQSRAERFVKLPKNVSEQVQLIRNDDLDILLIGTNITAVNHGITLLGLHRLARIQITSTSSCVTTGMRNIDYYISGTLTEIKQNPQAQYREKLILLEGTAHCFSYYATPPELPQVIPHRSSLGISEQAVVFISGANFYKIIPELRETWAKLLAKVPNSVLVLYPFNPNWASQYRALPWINNFKALLAEYGVDPSRLILIKPQGSRSDIKEYLKLADIYLDSYPFSGVNSLVDPLEVGLVPVVRDGDVIPSFSPDTSQAGEVFVVRDSGSFRSLMAASLLRSLSLDDLIANSEESYINLAITLANTPQLRQQKSQEIQQKMQQNPEFLDSRTYSAKMGVIFQQLFQNWQQNQHHSPSIQLNSREAIQQYLSALVNHINHYELEPHNQAIVNQLRSIRKIMVEHWLKIPPEQLEKMYTTDLGKGYQILLNRGIQWEPLTPEEEQLVSQITQQAIGLKQSDSLNHLMVLMLYYPPGKMVVANAETRLPEWLLKEYQRVFENPSALEKVTVSDVGKNQPLTPIESFQNRLIGCVNLYKIDPANAAIVEELRQIRRQFADFWLGLEATQLESVYQSAVGQTYRTLLYSGFSQETLTTTEQQFIKTLATQMNQGLNQMETIKPLLAVLLYCRPEQLQIQDLSRLPQWFRPDYEQLSHQ